MSVKVLSIETDGAGAGLSAAVQCNSSNEDLVKVQQTRFPQCLHLGGDVILENVIPLLLR